MVANRGPVAAREIVQVYLTGFADDGHGPVPRENLVFFRAVDLAPGEEQEVPFRIAAPQMRLVDVRGQRTRQPRAFDVFAGGSSPHPRARALGAPEGCRQQVVFDS
jgi:beta-glucosidase